MLTGIILQIAWKIYKTPPWWFYLFSLGFIVWGRYNLILWRRSIDPKATPWRKAITTNHYKLIGRGAILGGIIFLVISIYQVCKSWHPIPVWFYFLVFGLLVGGIGLFLLWRKSVGSNELTWDNILKNYYFIFGLVSVICGLAGLMFGFTFSH